MSSAKSRILRTDLGEKQTDQSGSPVSVARMDAQKATAGIGLVLQKYINDNDENAWAEIMTRIDYIFENISQSMDKLNSETGFGKEIKERLQKGQKLLFKPNLVGMMGIDPVMHGPGPATTTLTDWSFTAAVMRWYHDSLNISYHQMSIGEAATVMPASAKMLTLANPSGETVTTEAAIEGKCNDFHGGWGFYFARKYLAERLDENAVDDPMNGYEESVTGTYIPPGQVTDKLMVYDLNRIFDDPDKGLLCEVPDGANFDSIMLHKTVVGGDKNNAADMANYPGAILINLPKLKVHSHTLLTNVIKNLGIGLYPMQYASKGGCQWDYSVPPAPVPGMKGPIPHAVWVAQEVDKNGMPARDEEGHYLVKKTAGINATMIDIIKAVQNQDIMMVHVADGIEATNIDHTGSIPGVLTPEGLVIASLDPVAADNLSVRYMFSNVGMKEAKDTGIKDRNGKHFPQAVPVPQIKDGQIVTTNGYDCPLNRDDLLKSAEERGLGRQEYYAIGADSTGAEIVSIEGRMGTVDGDTFKEIVTETLFFGVMKFPWDMQATALGFLKASDSLMGTDHYQDFMNEYDEDGDGIVTYNEMGKKGVHCSVLYTSGLSLSRTGADPVLTLKRSFNSANMIKNSDPAHNAAGHHLMKEFTMGPIIMAAFGMSRLDFKIPDQFKEGLSFGQGNWPTFEMARAMFAGRLVFGPAFPMAITAPGLFSTALMYADVTQNEGRLLEVMGNPIPVNPEVPHKYVEQVVNGQAEKLDFTLYLPKGLEIVAGINLPNVEVPEDETLLFTAKFPDGTVLPLVE